MAKQYTATHTTVAVYYTDEQGNIIDLLTGLRQGAQTTLHEVVLFTKTHTATRVAALNEQVDAYCRLDLSAQIAEAAAKAGLDVAARNHMGWPLVSVDTRYEREV